MALPRDSADPTPSNLDQLLRDNRELTRMLEEAEEALRALRAGEVDALLVGAGREQVYTLETVDKPYQLLVERVPFGAATLTTEGSILSCNRRFAALLHRSQDALIGQPLHAFVAPASRPRLEALLAECRTSEAEGEIVLQGANDTPVPVYLGATSLREGALGSCLMVTDLTESRHLRELERTQEALRATTERLEQADRNKDEFLATLAHELRNPLAPIMNSLTILKGKNPKESEWALGVLDRQVQTMARLLDDVLDVSRISCNKLELRKQSIDLRSVLESALEVSRPWIAAAEHELLFTMPSEPIHLLADPLRLSQVFANLLNNAAKYTEPKGRIWLDVSAQDQQVIVSVRDNGIGIAPAMVPRVFEIFAQAASAEPRSQGGLGIGLSLAKGLIELHGGTIEARSDGPGKGTEFLVRLPLAKGSPEGELLASAAERSAAPSSAQQRILIVDDNRDNADSLAKLLRKRGHEIWTVYSGEEALQAVETARPDVVLLDLEIPKPDGFEVCRRIRSGPLGRAPLLVAMTGRARETDRERTREAGFDHHMAKPIDPGAILGLLSALPAGD
jgi:signal transduction histidine kinase/ActR/RegA family two-component response regulator